MTSRGRIFFTGITGTVGGWLGAEALRHGFGLTALMRDQTVSGAAERVRSVLALAGVEGGGERVAIVPGDLSDDPMRLVDRADALGDVSLICHCAAHTGFDDADARINHAVNVEGTVAVLDLASRLRVPLVYISTAYVSGRREGVIHEHELDVGQRFNNSYEATKCQAELLVLQWAERTGLPVTVLRPGIVVGDWRNGNVMRFNTIYHLMRFFDTVASSLGNGVIRVAARAEATKNIIPVDYFARAAWHIISSGQPGTYHLTAPSPIALGELRSVFGELFGTSRTRLVDE